MEESRDAGRVPSIRARIALLASFVGAVLLGLQSYTAVQQYAQARDAGVAEVIAVAQRAAASTSQFLTRTEVALQSVAFRRGAVLMNPEGCRSEVAVLGASLPSLSNVAVAAADGHVVCTLERPQDAPRIDMTTRSWFRSVLTEPRFVVSSPYAGSFTGELIVTMAAPILGAGGEVLGVVGGPTDLAVVQEVVGAAKSHESDLITIADAERVIVARSSSPERWVGEPLPPPLPESEYTRDGLPYVRAADIEGTMRVWGEASIPRVGWTVWAAVPVDVVFGPAAALARTQILWAAGLATLAALLAVWTYRGLGRPLVQLADGAREAAEGAPVPTPDGAPRELRVVVDEFNRTLEARDRARFAERRARDRYRALFDNAAIGIYRSTVEGEFVDVNPAMVAMLGYASESELKAVALHDLYRDPDRRRDLVEQLSAVSRFEGVEVEWLRKDGSVATLRLAGRLVSDPGLDRVLEVFVRDITREVALREYTLHQQKLEALGRIAGGLAHELNNLLTVIQVNAEILSEELEGSELRQEATEIGLAVERGVAFTSRLLAFSRHDTGSVQVADVNQRVDDCERMLQRAAGEGLRLELDLAPGLGGVRIDPAHIDQALLNLVLNARDALSGEGEVVVKTESVVGGGDNFGANGCRYVVLSVSDGGVGMTPEVRAQAFDPFFTTKPAGKGTGLGLAAVHGIVEEVGGFARIESEPGAGCRLELWLPVLEDPEAKAT